MLSKANGVKKMAGMPLSPVALTIAGYDPSSGAGITADLQVFTAHGVLGVSAVTALTVQAQSGVRRIQPVGARFLQETLDLLSKETEIAGVKIGMLATAEVARTVTKFLSSAGISRDRIVLDPVMRASSGAELLDSAGVNILREEMLPRVGWVTPNVEEAAVLAGLAAGIARAQVPVAAEAITRLGDSGLHVVVTGGHLDPPDDFLLEADGRHTWFSGRRAAVRSIHGTHGTGCVFSSALLCRLLLGDAPLEAVQAAKEFVVRRLEE